MERTGEPRESVTSSRRDAALQPQLVRTLRHATLSASEIDDLEVAIVVLAGDATIGPR